MVQHAAASTRFRETKALVRLALNDGLTQKEIAEQSRTSQSVVSAQANGKARAKQHQVEWLVERYGHQLQSKRMTVYLCPQSKESWEESEEARVVTRLAELRAAYKYDELETNQELAAQAQALVSQYEDIPFHLDHDYTIPNVERYLREHQTNGRASRQYARVDGPVVWRHLADEGEAYQVSKPILGTMIRWQPVGRMIVHQQARDKFILVMQRVRTLPSYVQERWHTELNKAAERRRQRYNRSPDMDLRLHSRADEGRWFSKVHGPFSKDELLSAIDEQLSSLPIHDQQTVPFLIRKMLIERGYDVGNTQHFR